MEWEPFYKRGEGQTLGLFYQIVYGIALPYLKDLILPFQTPQHGYNLRNVCNFNFVIIQSMTFTYYDSFLPSSVQLWNNLLWKQSVMSGFFFQKCTKTFCRISKKKMIKFINMKIAKIMLLTVNLKIDPVTYNFQLIKIVDAYVMIMFIFCLLDQLTLIKNYCSLTVFKII